MDSAIGNIFDKLVNNFVSINKDGGRYWLADERKIILNEFIYKRIGLIRAERTS